MKVFLLSVLLTGCMQLVIGQNGNNNAADPDSKIKFEKVIHDYGAIARKSDGACVFSFTNTGKEPLILSNVTTSCGCTVPSWTKAPIAPGGKGEIRVVYNTKIIGPFSKTITATFKDIGLDIILTIKGTVAK